MKKTAKIMTGLVLAATMALSACGGKNEENGGASSPAASASNNGSGAGMKVGMVTDTGGVHDKSFNQSAWEGLEQFKAETGAETNFLESKEAANYLPHLNQFVKDGYDLTWGIGYLLADAVKEAATANPDAKLGLIDSVVEAPNVASITFAENEGSYLVGYIAGLMTKTNKVGFVGGMEGDLIKRFEVGFAAGVKAAKPDVEVISTYTGDFARPDLGKAAAATLYNDGVDIIFHASGGTGNGVFNEAIERKKAGKDVWVIGVDKDQSLEFGDDVTLTSMMKRVDQAVWSVSKQMADGAFPGGKVTVLGLKDNGVGIAETSTKNVPADILAKVEEQKAKIISGEIVVPAT